MKIQPINKTFDQINVVFAQALGLSDSQLDFVINYGIKDRMEQGASNDD